MPARRGALPALLLLVQACAGGQPVAGAGHELPLPASAVVPVNTEPGTDVYSVVLPSARGYVLLFEHYDENFTRGRLEALRFDDASPDGTAMEIDLGTAALIGAPSYVQAPEAGYLYVMKAPDLGGPASVERHAWDGTGFGPAERIELPEAITMLSWPRFLALQDGTFALAYRDVDKIVKLSTSTDGIVFGPPRIVGPAGAQPEIGQFADGTLVYTFQQGPKIRSFHRVSRGGVEWSDAELVTRSSDEVHDTDVFPRRDGAVDLYYIYHGPTGRYTLWRRCLRSDGTLGPEEQVVVPSWGDLAKPRAHRLDDGTILLTFVDQDRGHLLFRATLRSDAACANDR